MLLLPLLCTILVTKTFSQTLKDLQNNHRPQSLSGSDVRHLAQQLANPNHLEEVLDKILIPRVVGTPNHEKVFQYIKRQLKNLQWHVEIDEFQDNVPKFGRLTFKNIIASTNPQADRFLVLACHYDSKFFADNDFVGATDSAVPCAMILNLAKQLNPLLQSNKNPDLALKVIFFDGEEAFENWGPKDSIYGAKHLASTYHKTRVTTKSTGERISELDKIDMLVLLDLIGHKGSSFVSYFTDTQNWFLNLADIEDTLEAMHLIRKHRHQTYFQRVASYGRIEDDHLPFLNRNVPILHLISTPFPKEWHRPEDNRRLIDLQTTENINAILRVFVAQYLHLFEDDQTHGLRQNQENLQVPDKEL